MANLPYMIRMELSAEESEQNAGCYCRTDDAGHIRTHGMHQQIVRRVVLQTEVREFDTFGLKKVI